MEKQKIFVWPSTEILAVFFKWFLIVLSVFMVIYNSCNAYAATCINQYHMYADWELSIPLVPPMIIIYLGYAGIFGVVPFVFKEPAAIKGLALCMLVIIMVSAIIFVTFPGHLGYNRTDEIPGYGLLFKLLFSVDGPHNLFPSLHVSFAYLCALCMIEQTNSRGFHLSLKIWFAMVCASVILVHQHHIFDIILGMVLSWVVFKIVYVRTITLAPLKRSEAFAH